MTRRVVLALSLVAALGLPLAAQSFSFNTGDSSLDVTLSSINVEAEANIGPYTADLSATYGVEQPRIRTWMAVDRLQPAEVFLVLEMGRISDRPPATVIAVYKKNKGKGWGAIAKALGMKPGSPAFKALKASAEEKNRKERGRKGKR